MCVWPRVLDTPPHVENLSISSIVDNYGDTKKVNLCPAYQREIRWTIDQMCGLILSIMLNRFIPPMLFYKYQPDDEKMLHTHKFECIDAQHRMYTIVHFKKGLPVSDNKKNNMIYLYNEETRTYIFYEENEHTKDWSDIHTDRTVRCMTEDERDCFNEVTIVVQSIRTPMSFEQRCDQFVCLQRGTQVRGSDLYKNFQHVKIIKQIMEMKLEGAYKKNILERLTVKQPLYWLHNVIRLFLLVSAKETEREKIFNNTDNAIKAYIKKNAHQLNNYSDEHFSVFTNVMTRLFKVLDTLPSSVKFTPVQFYAFFDQFQSIETNEAKLLDYVKGWAGKGSSEEKSLWCQTKHILGDPKHPNAIMRSEYYKRCINELSHFNSFPIIKQKIKIPRKNIPKKMRTDVWNKWSGTNAINSTCWTCDDPVSHNEWDCGHIIAHVNGGKNEIDNLRIQCINCNRSQGDENALEYKTRVYPDSITL